MLGFIIFAASAPTVIQQNTGYAFTMVIVAAVLLVLSGNLFIVDAIKWQGVHIILEYFKHSVLKTVFIVMNITKHMIQNVFHVHVSVQPSAYHH